MHRHPDILRPLALLGAATLLLTGLRGTGDDRGEPRPVAVETARPRPGRVVLASHAQPLRSGRSLPTIAWDDPVSEPASNTPSQLPATLVAGPLAHASAPASGSRPVPWPLPAQLVAQLDALEAPPLQAWSAEVKAALQRLHATPPPPRGETDRILQQLGGLARQTLRMAQDGLASNDARVRLLSTSYALQRRVDLWQAVMSATQPHVQAEITRVQLESAGQVLPAVADVRREMGAAKSAQAWEAYLLLAELEGWAQSSEPHDYLDRDQVVHRVLERLDEAQARAEHHDFLATPAMRRFREVLQGWSTRPVDYAAWFVQLEQIESQPSAAAAGAVAAVNQQLHWSRVAAQRQVSETFSSHYRNANVRLAVTEDFVNRLVPVIQDVRSPVREEILGAQVLGNSATWTEVRVKFLPDDARAHLQLLANGNVAAQTTSFKGPVVLYNRNRSEFFLRKDIICDTSGFQVGKSDAVASGNSYLLGLQTQFDKFPLLGAIVRRAARQQMTEQKHLARRIFERRVARRAEEQIDAEVTEQIAAAEQRLDDKLLAPLQQMDLDPRALQMQTSEAGGQPRMIFRGRLAGPHQLAAFTPRPRALAHNLISLQLHESTLNNFVQQLQLGGQRGDLREMLAELYQRYPALGQEVPEDVPEDVTIQLADHDPLRFSFDDDCLRLTLRVAELSAGRHSWRYFVVSVRYLPEPSGFQVELSRDGVVELVGRRLRFADQVALRGIFVKVFSQNRNFKLILPELAEDPRLTDLTVDQIVLRDGWLGLSIGDQPQKVAHRPAP